MQRLLAAILVSACLVSPALAHSRHHTHHRHYQRQVNLPQLIVCDRWSCSDRAERVVDNIPVLPLNTRKLTFNRFPRNHPNREVTTRHPITRTAHAFIPGTGLVTRARQYLGMGARSIGLHRHSQWCAAFIRFLGVEGPVDDRAISFNHLNHVAPQVGAIAVYPHHVGIVTGFDGRFPIIISGNYRNTVHEGTYPRTPIAYVTP